MERTSLSQEMLKHFMQPNEAEQKSVLEMIKTFLSSRHNDFISQSIGGYSRELEEADAELKPAILCRTKK